MQNRIADMIKSKTPAQAIRILRSLLKHQSQHVNYLSQILFNAMSEISEGGQNDDSDTDSNQSDGLITQDHNYINEEEQIHKQQQTTPDTQNIMFLEAQNKSQDLAQNSQNSPSDFNHSYSKSNNSESEFF